MAGELADKIRVFDLLVEVADEGASGLCELATSQIGCCSDCLVTGLTVVTTRSILASFIATQMRSLSFPVLMKGKRLPLLLPR